MARPAKLDASSVAIIVLLLSVACLLAYVAFLLPPCAGCNAKVSFVFSPGAQGEVLSFIRSAQKSVDIEMYVFTSDDVLRELAEAEKRGVQVRVILEPRVEDSRKDKVFATLLGIGADARWASMEYKLTHSKFIIVDGKKALVGSINFSQSALTANREAAAEIEGEGVKELSAIFEEDWQKASAG